jgi:hypothetical protein
MSQRNFSVSAVQVPHCGNMLINYGGTGMVLSFMAGMRSR